MTGALQVQPFIFPNGIPPQATGFPAQSFQSAQPNAFGQPPTSQPQHRPFSTFLQPQPTGFAMIQPGFVQPQPTGANPFRQSMMLMQGTGAPTFNLGATNAFSPQSHPSGKTNPLFQLPSTSHPQQLQQPFAQSLNGFASQASPSATEFGQINGARTSFDIPTRPASTPLTAFGTMQSSSTSPPTAQPVQSHQTGSRNPFGVPVTPAPPVPKPPTMMELAMGIGNSNSGPPANSVPPQPQQTSLFEAHDESSISSVASSFALSRKLEDSKFGPSGFGILNPQSTSSTTTATTASDSLFSSFSPLSSQSTGVTITSSSSAPVSQLKPQMTGFNGLKPFKPTSSFGASLLESLPPIPQSGPTTPNATGSPNNPSYTSSPNGATSTVGAGGSSTGQQSVGALNTQPTGWPTLGVGLRPQATGAAGGANPFRATMYAMSSQNAGGGSALPTTSSLPQFGATNGSSSFGSSYGSGPFPFNSVSQDPSRQPFQQQSGTASLI